MTQQESAQSTKDKNKFKTVYILMTQCLQNSFFFSEENRLRLPEQSVRQLLVGNNAKDATTIFETTSERGSDAAKRKLKKGLLEQGPLYMFLDALINDPKRENNLHIINVKDWHTPTEPYDIERRKYGTHSEEKTWGAKTLDGIEQFLEPWALANFPEHERKQAEQQALDPATGYKLHDKDKGKHKEDTYLYEIRSNSVFDFQPAYYTEPIEADEDAQRHVIKESQLDKLLDRIIGKEDDWHNKRIYLVVIGVYTDIKIKTLLTGLRSRYIIQNLITSDVLTTAPTLERHLSGLDYADKVLQVEIIHSLNELVDVLHEDEYDNVIPPEIIQDIPNFNDYKNYYLDKHLILAQQDNKLGEYLTLTRRRSEAIYQRDRRISNALTWFGLIFLGFALIAIIIGFFSDNIQVDLVAITGGLGLAGIIAVFFRQPSEQLRESMLEMVRLRNYLETYSSVNTLIRHHLTMPEYLNIATQSPADLERHQQSLAVLREQIKILGNASHIMQQNLDDIMGEDETEQGTINPTSTP
jgi:hypothetical protein